ncbi:hypothetical protein TNCV_2143671 [Trichonephila clavipes]|nr:hypothetical protein TNCV_2143671 [Trichonephila clavipes]
MWHEGTLNSRQAPSPLVRLKEVEELWEELSQRVLSPRASLPYTAGLQWYWARTRDKASHDPMPIPLGYRGHILVLKSFSSAFTLMRLRAKTALILAACHNGHSDRTLSAAVFPWRPEENLKHTKKNGTDKDYTTII